MINIDKNYIKANNDEIYNNKIKTSEYSKENNGISSLFAESKILNYYGTPANSFWTYRGITDIWT